MWTPPGESGKKELILLRSIYYINHSDKKNNEHDHSLQELHLQTAVPSSHEREQTPVTYVDVDTVATAQGNIVTISAPPFPSGKGVGGWGPLKTTAAWF